MTFIRFDVLAFAFMLVLYLREVKVLPPKPVLVLLGIMLGLMLFVLLVSAHVVALP